MGFDALSNSISLQAEVVPITRQNQITALKPNVEDAPTVKDSKGKKQKVKFTQSPLVDGGAPWGHGNPLRTKCRTEKEPYSLIVRIKHYVRDPTLLLSVRRVRRVEGGWPGLTSLPC